MKLTIQMQLLPTAEQAVLLRSTMERFNEAPTFAARIGFDAGVFSQISIHKLCYLSIRERFKISAQMAVRAIGKAVECFKRDKTICPVFKPLGAMTYDERFLSFKGLDKVSILTLSGRELIALVYGQYQSERFDRIKGQCDLVYRGGKWFLYSTIDLPEPPPDGVTDFLGVDLGIVSLAKDSTGEGHSGEAVDRNRRRRATARKQYQRKGTKNAKRKLKLMSGRQGRFKTWVNHGISKRLVGKAKALGVGIALEDLKGIRSRIEKTVGTKYRRRFGNWAFAQLKGFVEYKARLAGVPVVLVDPRDSSRTCNVCGHCEKANRKSQSEFDCKHCGLSTNADENAALNLRAWAKCKLASKAAG